MGMAESSLQASSLAALAGIRHAFFTRAGGVSQGIYSSLNGGVGSNDARAHVAENRARMGGRARRRARRAAQRLSDPFRRRGGRRGAVDP
jgi:copper oxidase (laccase) domain-containing protein